VNKNTKKYEAQSFKDWAFLILFIVNEKYY